MENILALTPKLPATVVSPSPLWLRLPAPKSRCPLTGLSRSTLVELILPSAANGGRPPVKSITLRKRGATRGIRLVSYESLTDYLNSLADPAPAAAPPARPPTRRSRRAVVLHAASQTGPSAP